MMPPCVLDQSVIGTKCLAGSGVKEVFTEAMTADLALERRGLEAEKEKALWAPEAQVRVFGL